MPKITITVSEENKEIISRYAALSQRSISNLAFHAITSHMSRLKKFDSNGQQIKINVEKVRCRYLHQKMNGGQ